MKPRTRPLKNLYFRWAQHYGLNDSEVASVLESQGLITVLGDYYQETDKMRELKNLDLEIHKLLKPIERKK